MTLTLAVGAVFLLAALTPLLTRALDRNAGYVGAGVLAAVATWIGLQAPAVLDDRPVTQSFEWLPDAGISFALRLDGLAMMFALIVLGIGALVLAYAARYFGAGSAKTARYLALLTFFAGSMLGLVLADDALLLFVFWEFTSVSSFFLIGGLGEGKQGATRAFLTTALGGLALLAGLVLLAVVAGTGSLSGILAAGDTVLASGAAEAAIVLLLLGAFTKSAQFPFHFWLPGAMVAPTPVSTYLHAATMVKAGIYLMFRFTPLFGDVALWQIALVLFGGGTALFAAVVATKQHDLKALLAYSTVSQLGLITAIIGIGSPRALAAAALHTVAHALYKATLFMTVGIIDHETGTRDIRQLGGLRRTLPVTALAGGVAAASMAGLPPLLGFVSKEEILDGFLASDPAWLGLVGVTLAVLASIGTVAYSARYYLRTFEGEERTHAHKAPFSFAAPAAIAGLAGLAFGLVVKVFDPLVNTVALATTGEDPGLHLALWHGIGAPLVLSTVIIGLGVAAVVFASHVERFQGRFALPSGAGNFDRTYDGILRFGGWVGRPSVPHAPSAYLLPVFASIAVVALVAAASVGLDGLGTPAESQLADWAVIILLGMSIGGTITARSRLAAIAMLGLAGFTVALWFVLLGAPDLALTQLLVETLSVALFVVVFRRLPWTFARGGQTRRRSAAVIAALVGVTVGTGTYLFTGRRGPSAVGERFMADGYELSGGTNVVNTILVDFRALDTMGEITVLAVAATAIYSLVRHSPHQPLPRPEQLERDLEREQGMIDSPILHTATLAIAPAMVIASVWLLWRGHNAVGGGFIGGLAAGSAAVLLYFARGHQRIWNSTLLRTIALVGSGLIIAIGHGLGGLVITGSFLDGAKWHLPLGIETAASLVFDIGVYIVVVGLVVAIVRHLGQHISEPSPDPRRANLPNWASDRADVRPRWPFTTTPPSGADDGDAPDPAPASHDTEYRP